MTVKLEVPFNKHALAAAATFFQTLADSNPVQAGNSLVLGSKVAPVDVTNFEVPDLPVEHKVERRDLVRDAAGNWVDELDVPEPDETPESSDGLGLDSRGFPWDARIHAGAKSKNKDLTWRYKPGVDKALIPKVEAELLQNMNAGKAAAPDVVPEPDETPIAEKAVAAQQAATAPAADAPTFADVMKRAAEAVKQGALAMTDIDQWAKDKGLASKAGLAMNATVRAEFGEYLTFIGF